MTNPVSARLGWGLGFGDGIEDDGLLEEGSDEGRDEEGTAVGEDDDGAELLGFEEEGTDDDGFEEEGFDDDGIEEGLLVGSELEGTAQR